MPEILRRPFLWKIFNFLITLIITSYLKFSYAEGTRELQPNSTQIPQLTLSYEMPVTSNTGGPFATPVAPPEYRLWVSVAAPTEAVHFGFQKQAPRIFSWLSKTVQEL